MTKQGAARVIQQLLEEGYLRYDEDARGDARAKPVALSGRGREVVALATEVQDRIEAAWAEAVGPRQVAGARRVLEKVVRHGRDELPPVRLGW
jgi:DNA-binding MarR family transcriptional regulator